MKTTIALFILQFVLLSNAIGQIQRDSVINSKTPLYHFHLNHKAQDGYGIILGYLGSNSKDLKTLRNIFEIGIIKEKHDWGDDGLFYDDMTLSLEVNKIKDKTYYGFKYGLEARALSISDLGIGLVGMTDFSSHRAISIRPILGLCPYRKINLEVNIGYDIYPLKANFDIVDHFIFGFRFLIGVVEKETSESEYIRRQL